MSPAKYADGPTKDVAFQIECSPPHDFYRWIQHTIRRQLIKDLSRLPLNPATERSLLSDSHIYITAPNFQG